MSEPQHIRLQLPEGLLEVVWPAGQVVWADELTPVARDAPQDPAPVATLDGKAIDPGRVEELLAAEIARGEAHGARRVHLHRDGQDPGALPAHHQFAPRDGWPFPRRIHLHRSEGRIELTGPPPGWWPPAGTDDWPP